jgi:hypothetical protein
MLLHAPAYVKGIIARSLRRDHTVKIAVSMHSPRHPTTTLIDYSDRMCNVFDEMSCEIFSDLEKCVATFPEYYVCLSIQDSAGKKSVYVVEEPTEEIYIEDI